jgi:SOS-response transcriptional repressor LexA
MKAFENSMLPILKRGSLLTFARADDYEPGDIVFCKVKGRYILIKKNNHAGINNRKAFNHSPGTTPENFVRL